jgi:hypothetical protein
MNLENVTGHALDRAGDCSLCLAKAMKPGEAERLVYGFLGSLPEVGEDTAFVIELPVSPTDDSRAQWGEVTHLAAVVRPYYKFGTPLGGYMVRSVFFTRESQLHGNHLRVEVIEEVKC